MGEKFIKVEVVLTDSKLQYFTNCVIKDIFYDKICDFLTGKAIPIKDGGVNIRYYEEELSEEEEWCGVDGHFEIDGYITPDEIEELRKLESGYCYIVISENDPENYFYEGEDVK